MVARHDEKLSPLAGAEALLLKFVAHHLWQPLQRDADPDHGMPAAVEESLRDQGFLRTTDHTRPIQYAGVWPPGVLYSSRLTSAECVAVYDRAVSIKLEATPAVNLIRHPDLIAALRSIDVTIRKA